ncbi:MAG: histidine kinase [Gemmatimonadota bacterium]|jgi:signal transduction histidine kinase
MKARVVGGVCVLWLLVGAVLGAQSGLQASLQGQPVVLWSSLRDAFIQTAPWIPVTLTVVWLSVRFPVTSGSWKRNVWVHLAALPLVTFAANVLVVMGFWISVGSYQGLGALLQGGLFWATMRIHVAALIYAVVVAGTQGVVYYRETRARELRVARLEGQLARARLQALNSQIRPHFLFNTLHTIGQLWRSGRSDDADAMLDHLGSLFQKVQSTGRSVEVPLSEELEMVREYLAIEAMRFPDRLRPSVDASPGAAGCLVPPLLLQPLVENAIRHGISASSAAGRVAVRARVDDGRLRIEVEDDGPGMGASTPSPGSGTGLANTRDRLEQLYGDAHRVEIRDATGPVEGRGAGTLVVLQLPARRRVPSPEPPATAEGNPPGARDPAEGLETTRG